MRGRPCSICADPAKLRLAGEMIAVGSTDQAIADRIGGVNRMAVARHRTNHVVAPAQALIVAASKDRPEREKREQVLALSEAGDPLAFLTLAAIVADLKNIHLRLDRAAAAAGHDLSVH